MVCKLTFGALLVLSSAGLEAGNVFKCKDAKGNSTYQEVPCTKVEEQESHRVYQRQRDTPEQTRANFQRNAQHYRNQVAPRASYSTFNDAGQGSTRSSTDPELARKLADREANLNRYSGNRKVDQLRRDDARKEIEQLRQQMGVAAAPTSAPGSQGGVAQPNIRTGPGFTEPKTIRDQYGNQYSQPPGSAFATDQQTGKQCFVYGNFVKCD